MSEVCPAQNTPPEMIIFGDIAAEHELASLSGLRDQLRDNPVTVLEGLNKLSPQGMDQDNPQQAGVSALEFAVSRRGVRLYEYDEVTETDIQTIPAIRAARKRREDAGDKATPQQEHEIMRTLRIERLRAFAELLAGYAIAQTYKPAPTSEVLPLPLEEKPSNSHTSAA